MANRFKNRENCGMCIILVQVIYFLSSGFLFALPDSTTAKTKLISIKLLPAAYYMPETRIGIGALANSFFRLSKKDTLSRKSNMQSYLSITQNKQFFIENDWQLFSRAEKYIFSGSFDYTRFPEYFYGIGNFTSENKKELYSFDLIHLHTKNLRRIKNKWFVGIQYEMQYLYDVKKEDANMMNGLEVPGNNGYFISVPGALLMYDSRNNVLNATSGSYIEAHMAVNNRYTLSSFEYYNTVVDLRNYHTFFNWLTVAVHGYGNFNFGTIPFRAMPAIGGARYLRGFYRGRFRDNNMIAFQGETRFPLFWKVGGAVFGGIAQVAHRTNNFNLSSFKYNCGTGLRYQLDNKEQVNLRLDVGFTNEGYGIYVVFAEAF